MPPYAEFTTAVDARGFNDLTGDGRTKERWFALQRIIADVEIRGDVADVGVSFVDKEASKGYLTKFGLHRVNGKWKIFSFKNVSDYDQN